MPGLLMIALAIYFHPTYLLAGMILVLAFMGNTYLERKTLRLAFSYGLLFLFLISPVLLYVFSLIGGESSEAVSQAQHILVSYRIPHHALIKDWFDSTSVAQIIIMIIGGIVLRRRSRRLFSIVGISSVLMALLSVVQYISSNETLALAFPWRLSTVLVPLATCAVIVRLVDTLWRNLGNLAIERTREFRLILGALLVIVVIAGIARFQIEVKQQRTSPEIFLIDFITQEKRPGDVYLIPPKMQDFRLASGAPIYVDFKSIPYRPEEVLEWYRRIRIVEEFYGSGFPDCSGFLEWAITEEVNHAVVFPDSEVITCPGWKIIFEDKYYILLRRTG